MIDFEKIGKRILEERKYIHKLSQEKMAEDLGMYQADISNLEKAKNGSGITDLSKLDMIADYFDVPLETLLFGRRQDQMEKYYGSKMKIKPSKKKLTRKHETILKRLMGETGNPDDVEKGLQQIIPFECGRYMIYALREFQIMYTGAGMEEDLKNNSYTKAHLYVVYQDEVIACMVAGLTTVMQHVYQPEFQRLKNFIHPDIFDLDDTLQVLNPYCLLYEYAVSEEEEEFRHQMLKRMDELRATGKDRIIYYIENAYVREDCRRNGILRMMLDVLKTIKADSIMWLSLEPTSGAELNSEYAYHATYESSELGQLHLNASIAEHLGFTVDPKTVMRLAERVEEDGEVVTENVQVRRTAFYLPKKIRNVLKGDEKILAQARARETAFNGNEESDRPTSIDVFSGSWKKYGFVIAIKMTYSDEIVFTFARGMDWKTHWLGVSKSNPAVTGESVETIEKYDQLEEAAESKYYEGLKMAEQFLGMMMYSETSDAGLQYLKDIKFDRITGKYGLVDRLAKLFGKNKANEIFDKCKQLRPGTTEFYEYKNSDPEICKSFAEAFDGDVIRSACNFISSHKDYFGKTILEVGCDAGYMTVFLARLFPNSMIVAIDRGKNAIDLTRKKLQDENISNVKLINCSLADLDEKFDTVFCMRTIQENLDYEEMPFCGEHILYQCLTYAAITKQFTEQLKSCLKENGHLCVFERLGHDPLLCGWLLELNEQECGIIEDTYHEYPCKEVEEMIDHQAFICKNGTYQRPDEIIQFWYKAIDINVSDRQMLKGWNALVYLYENAGQFIRGVRIYDKDEFQIGRFVIFVDKDDDTLFYYYFATGNAEDNVLYGVNLSQKDEMLEHFNRAIEANKNEGCIIEKIEPEDDFLEGNHVSH